MVRNGPGILEADAGDSISPHTVQRNPAHHKLIPAATTCGALAKGASDARVTSNGLMHICTLYKTRAFGRPRGGVVPWTRKRILRPGPDVADLAGTPGDPSPGWSRIPVSKGGVGNLFCAAFDTPNGQSPLPPIRAEQ